MIQNLTGLRFYAALLVFISHMYIFGYFMGWHEGQLPFEILNQLGALGVSVFFVLSGFVLFIHYNKPGTPPVSMGRFYLARFARIYPVFFLATLLSLPIEIFSPQQQPVFMPLLLNLSMVHCFDPAACNSINPPAWSLSSEFVFYLLFPLLASFFITQSHKRFAFAIGCYVVYMFVMTHLLNDSSFYYRASFPINRTGEFLLGMYAGYLYLFEGHRVSHWFTQIRIRWWVLTLMMVLAALLALQPLFPSFMKYLCYLYYAVPSAIIIFCLAMLEKYHQPSRLLTHPWVILGGEISYSFYLFHYDVIRYTLHFLELVFHVNAKNLSPGFSTVLVLGMFAITTLCAYGAYSWVEKPCRKAIMQWFERKRSKPCLEPGVNP